MSTFESTKRALPELLIEIVKGKLQLPDFQRGWVWDDSHVQSLLISVARSFPVGAIMLLETGGETRFQVRPIENVPFTGQLPDAEQLILDGQQRLTTLTQVLSLKKAVKTTDEKGRAIERHYYFDIEAALRGSETLEDALISMESDRKLKKNFGRDIVLDLSSRELECRQLFFPCSEIMNSDSWETDLHKYAPERFSVYMEFRNKVMSAFRSYQVPTIVLKKDTSKEAVCLVFEKVNTGGVPLSVFELVTATYAAEGYNLRDDWYGSAIRNRESRHKRIIKDALLRDIETTDYLQTISMLHTREKRLADIEAGRTGKQITAISAKRSAILALPLQAFRKWADPVESGFKLAGRFLKKECFQKSRDLPYRTQLAPLAAVLTILGERWLEPRIYDKLAQWYWCGVLCELYGGAVETRMANDVEDILAWIDGAEPPRTVADAAFRPDRLDRLSSRLSAAYKGLNILVLREGAKDFFWKAGIRELDAEETGLDIHHIFPQAWCESNGIARKFYNSIINKTPISYKANRMIGGSAPSLYLAKLQQHKQVLLEDSQMDSLLASHLIPPQHLRSDSFNAFFNQRKISLLGLVESAMGKTMFAQQPEEEYGIEEEDDDIAQAV